MLAGHDECEGEIITSDEPQYSTQIDSMTNIQVYHQTKKMKFYGMSSKEAMDEFNGGMKDYRAAEGESMLVDYQGPVKNTIQQILGGIRSACTYTGSRTLRELSKRTTFVRINRSHYA